MAYLVVAGKAPLVHFFACVGHIIWLEVWGLGMVGGLRGCTALGDDGIGGGGLMSEGFRGSRGPRWCGV